MVPVTKEGAEAFCQRWREKGASYRPAGEPIDATRYGVEIIRKREAKAFVQREHYAGTLPASIFHVGLFRTRKWFTPELVGVAAFSNPAAEAVIPHWMPTLGPREGLVLGRFVLLDDVEANGETWFLSRAFDLLRVAKPGLRVVLSYSDPIRRVATDGEVVLPGHVGTIYQAFNGRYVGRGSKKTQWLTPDGREIDHRALSKLRTDDVGTDYAFRQLLAAGAPQRRIGEAAPAYVFRALREGPFRPFRHPGNHAYLWPLDRKIRRALPKALTYPKVIEIGEPPRPRKVAVKPGRSRKVH